MSDYLARRSAVNWSTRFALSAIAYMVAYMVVGSATWPFIKPYYSDPSFGLALRIPAPPILILLQLGRGLVTTAVVFPLIATAPKHDFLWGAQLFLFLATAMGVAPLLLAATWPKNLRIAHALEITVFAIPYTLAVCYLLGTS